MPFKKGVSGNPGGRPRGARNRSTKAMKSALAQLIDDNLDNMNDWLDEMAKDDPKGAFQSMLSLMEFHMPKMSRVTHVDELQEEEKTSKGSEHILKAAAEALEQAIVEAEQKEFSGIRAEHEFIDKRANELLDQNDTLKNTA
jgi:hypothetical protein